MSPGVTSFIWAWRALLSTRLLNRSVAFVIRGDELFLWQLHDGDTTLLKSCVAVTVAVGQLGNRVDMTDSVARSAPCRSVLAGTFKSGRAGTVPPVVSGSHAEMDNRQTISQGVCFTSIPPERVMIASKYKAAQPMIGQGGPFAATGRTTSKS